MELAIPMIALGGMYLVSNQDKPKVKKIKEGYTGQRNTNVSGNSEINIVPETSAEERKERTYKPSNLDVNGRVRQELGNFPVNGYSNSGNLEGYYSNPNAPVDKIFHSDVYHNQASNDPNQYKSLTGNIVNAESLKHNNMVPFFGSKMNPSGSHRNNENRLDNMVGAGSQYIRKQEQAPLFKPQENTQWAHGTPNTSDFIQSRINPSHSMANVKPFEEIRVGPGLNEKGGVLGSGGFNAGMQNRQQWMPKTVDELRVANNPKETYKGVVLGGKREVQNRGMMGKMEKHRPDTYYENGPERYFTTTGVHKAQSIRSNQVLRHANRSEATRDYYGNAGDNNAGQYLDGQHTAPKRAVLEADIKHISNAKAMNDNPNARQIEIQSHAKSVTMNNRTIDQSRERFTAGPMQALTSAVIAPLMDVLRPSRKENFIGNLRKTGNIATVDAGAGYVYNPAEKAKKTIRETTENSKGHKFINSQKEAGGYGYIVNKQTAVTQQRDTTSKQYSGAGYLDGGMGYNVTDHYAPVQQRETTNRNHIGGAGNTGYSSQVMTYDAAYNAHLINKEPTLRGRKPTQTGQKVFNGDINMRMARNDKDRNNNRVNVPTSMVRATPTIENYGKMTIRSDYGQDIHMQRNSAETLNAFKSNPYTKPLNSVA